MSNVELDCGGKAEERRVRVYLLHINPLYRLLTVWNTDGRGTASLECTCNVKSQREMCMQALPSLRLPLSPRQPRCWAESAGKQQHRGKIALPESARSLFDICFLPPTNLTLHYAAACGANYSNATHFQLWTKCRDWSRSKPAENAAKTQKRSILLLMEILYMTLKRNSLCSYKK